jgi:hypothetical protein
MAGPLFVEGVAAIGEQLVATAAVGQLPDPAALPALVMAQVGDKLHMWMQLYSGMDPVCMPQLHSQ